MPEGVENVIINLKIKLILAKFMDIPLTRGVKTAILCCFSDDPVRELYIYISATGPARSVRTLSTGHFGDRPPSLRALHAHTGEPRHGQDHRAVSAPQVLQRTPASAQRRPQGPALHASGLRRNAAAPRPPAC